MHAGYVDGRLLFAAGMDGYEISAGTIHRADGECDSADFKLPASNTMRDVPVKRASVISIRRDGKEVFRGSVADTSTDLRGGRTYSVDGAMLWLADICKPPFTMTEDTMTYYVTALLTQYNAACLPTKQIQLGIIDTTLPSLTVEQTEYKTILALLQEGAQAVGGTLRIRYADGGIYLDVLKAYNHRCAQQVDIRKNLLDLTDKIDGADLITRVYPIGKDGLTIAGVNDGATYLANAAAEALYGRIDGTLRVDTDDAAALKAAAATYLAQNCGLSRGIQVSAADLSGSDITLEPYHIGDSVRVVSPPHGIDTIMTVSKLDTSLVGDKDTMTLGWSSKTLTGAVASGGSGSSSGTTTSGGGGTIDVDSALSLDSTNPVQNKIVTAALASKAGTSLATQSAAGLMSAADKVKLDGIEDGANKTIVDDAMSDTSTNPVQNKVIKQYVDEKGVNYFDTYVEKPTKEQLTAYADYYTCKCKATHTYAEIAAALAKDMVPRVLLVDVIGSAGANRIVCPLNEYYNGADGSYDFDAPNIAGMYGYGTGIVSISEDGADYTCSAGELPPATGNGKCLVVDDGRYRCGTPATATQSTPGYMSAADKAKLDGVEAGANKTIVDAALDAGSANPVQNKAVKAALDGKAGTAVATTSANGLMSAADKAKLDGVEAGANKTTVDAVLDAASENPVQNKAVKAALDKKLSTQGGEVSGALSLTRGITVGCTKDDAGIHLYKDSVGVAKLTSGSADVNDNVAMARLKVADPTEDDDAATKKYVDDRAVRYDAAQELTSDQKSRVRQNIGAVSQKGAWMEGNVALLPSGADGSRTINIMPSDISNDYTLTLDGGPENVPVYVAGLETPTDAQTDYAANVAYVKAKVAEAAASGGVDVDNALSATSTNPVQNKVVKSALDGKASTATATQSANGLMSKDDKAKLDGIASGATQVTIDSAMSGSSNNPVANHVVKQYVDDKVAATGSGITVDTSLSSTSTNPVQNKAVKAAIDAKADKTALDGKLDKTGGTLTGNLIGKYITGTWLQSTAAANLGKTPGKIAVLDDAGWVYYRTPAEILADIGAAAAGHTHDCYTKAETDAAIAVRASTSAYGTTKLSNSITSSSKTVAATPYAVKTALAQAKAYVDSAIAVAINSAY